MGWFTSAYQRAKSYVVSKISKPKPSTTTTAPTSGSTSTAGSSGSTTTASSGGGSGGSSGGGSTTTFKNPDGSTGTITITSLAPKQQDQIRSIDIVGGGHVTLRGRNVWGGGGSSGGGSTTTVTSSKGVTQGDRSYHGNTVVPNTGGKTANQLQAQGRLQAKQQGITGSWSTTITPANNTLVSATYGGGLSETQAKQIIGSKGFTKAYIKEGGGTPTSPQAFLAADKEYSKPHYSPEKITRESVAPKSFLGKLWFGVGTAYTASTFGMTSTVPDKYHRLRESGYSKWTNTLTLGEARDARLDQRVKEARAEQQIKAINTFNTKIENAPDDVKYKYYQSGRLDLAMAGITTVEKDGELKVFSPELQASTSQNVYDWRASKGDPLAKTFLVGRAGSAEALKFYVAGVGIGAVVGEGIAAIGTVSTNAAAVTTTGLKVAGYGALGVWGAGSAYTLYTTPKGDRGIKYAEVAGQGFGIGALMYGSYATRKTNQKIAAKNYQRLQRAEQLKNVKQLGQYSKYAKTGFKQAGTGKILRPSVVKGLSKQFGVSQATIRESSISRQYLNVKSPAGFKSYKTGKWGISITQIGSKGATQIGGTFRIYGGKPTSWNYLSAKSFGNYAYSTRITPKGKGYTTDNFLTKFTKTSAVSYGSGASSSAYNYQVRKIPTGYTAGTPKALWGKIGSTYTVSSGTAVRDQANLWRNIGGGLKIAKEGDYIFRARGAAQPTIATKNIPIQELPKSFIAKPTQGFSKTSFSSTFGSTGAASSTGNGGVKTVTTKSVQSSTISRLAMVTTPTVKIPTAQIRTAPLRTEVGFASLLGIGSIAAVKNIQQVKAVSGSKLQNIPAIKTVSSSRTKIVQIQRPAQVQAITPVTITSTISPTPPIVPPSFGTPSAPIPPINTLTPFAIPPIALGGFGGSKGYGRVKSQAKYGYTPSYTALAFGIVGKKKAPTIGKRYTGLEFRPITKEWASQFDINGRARKSTGKEIKLYM